MLARVRSSTWLLGRAFVVSLAVSALTVWPANARQDQVTLSGVIVDAESGRPLGGAVVHIRGTETAVVTNTAGQFRLIGVDPGAHTLAVSRAGFSPRNHLFEVNRDQWGEVDLGTISLAVSTAPLANVTGMVTDAATGEPIPQVPVELNGQVRAITDEAGRFRMATGSISRQATNRLTVRRIGYLPAQREFRMEGGQNAVDFDIALEPGPVRLEDIGVETDLVPLSTGRMTGFYRRRTAGMGRFFTRDQIRSMGARRITDVVRRLPGVAIFSEDNANVDPFDPGSNITTHIPVRIQFHRRGTAGAGRACSPLLFVNDMLIDSPDFDFMLPTRQIAGMEIYTSPAQVPVEYNKSGATCGVIVVWSDAPPGQGGRLSELELGSHLAARVRGGVAEAERIGVHLTVPIAGPVEFSPGLNLIFGSSGGRGNGGWQVFGNAKVRLFNRRSPWYVGTGATFVKVRPRFGDGEGLLRPIEKSWSHVLLTGVSAILGPVRPFVELQVLDLVTPGQTEGYVFAGFSIRSGVEDPTVPGVRPGSR